MLILNAQFDPTRTTLLRRKMISALRAKFQLLKQANTYNKPSIEQAIAGYSAQWLPYTQFAFTTGVKRSFSEARKGISNADILKTRQNEFMALLAGSINAQSHDLADRVQSELLNVASDVATRIRRVIADGRSQLLSQTAIRKNIKKAIDVGFTRSKSIVQTEITRSHAEGQLAAFETLGVTHVNVNVEWFNPNKGLSEKGNPSPCKLCKPLIGVTLTLKEAKGLIPRHPGCLCSFKAATKRLTQKREAERMLGRSVKAEGRKQTKWSGANRKIARRK